MVGEVTIIHFNTILYLAHPQLYTQNLTLMKKNIPIGSEIQGAELLNNDCYRNESDEFIIPDGEYLGAIFNRMPYGRIDKQVPGIGATTLELESERNSIIVVPTQYLAYTKSITSSAFYVGGDIIGTIDSPKKNEIVNFLNDNTIDHKKIIVVADSLGRVIREIEENLDHWFIMLDEIDSFQEQSSFRERLEQAIDYYLLFESTRRCMVSATLKEFSNERLSDEILLAINYPEPRIREISIINTDNILQALYHRIFLRVNGIFKNDEKIVVAFNSVDDSHYYIDKLPEHLREVSKLLCSKSSEHKAGEYYGELTKGVLPGKINFITSTYFTGIDFYDSYHLIYVSTIKKPYTLLSADKTYQIYGRSRDFSDENGKSNKGVLSETLIHNADGKVPNKLIFKESQLIEKAKKRLKASVAVEAIFKDDEEELEILMGLQRDIIRSTRHLDINLLRVNKDNSVDISYFNIDSIIENQIIRKNIYETPLTVVKHFKKVGHKITFITMPNPSTENDYPKKSLKVGKGVNEKRLEAFTNIINNGNIDILLDNSTGEESTFYRFYKRLSKLIESSKLNDLLEKITKQSFNSKTLRNFERSVKFVSLKEDRIFKKLIKTNFKIGEEYTKDEIFEKMKAIYNDYRLGFKPINNSQTAIQELSLYATLKAVRKRTLIPLPRGKKIVDFNPKGIVIRDGVTDEIWMKKNTKNGFGFDTVY